MIPAPTVANQCRELGIGIGPHENSVPPETPFSNLTMVMCRVAALRLRFSSGVFGCPAVIVTVAVFYIFYKYLSDM